MGSPAVAVDFLLEPDATIVERATAANDGLREVFPAGFALDDEHRPHITIVQGYYPTDRLGEIFTVYEALLDRQPILSWSLKAFGYYYLPWRTFGLAGITIVPSRELVELQRALLDMLAPFALPDGTADAFVRTAAQPAISQATIDHVRAFVEDDAGSKFNPHVTTGVATSEHLDQLLAEPFPEFTFSVTGVAAYQLANLGTVAKLLHSWEPQS